MSRGSVLVDMTILYRRIIGVINVSGVIRCLDASYDVHNNTRSHTGEAISM